MEEKQTEKTVLGFWVYLMTDLTMFAGLFAAYAVLHNNTFGSVSGKDIFDMPYVLIETLVLLTSSFTVALAVLFANYQKIKQSITFFVLTFLLGITFLGMELAEFSHLFSEGYTPQRSAFLSSYFALVGTHGLHITVGLLWILIMFVALIRKGFSKGNIRKLTLFGIFWHFLDIVWIFIFTIVYLMGVM